MADAELWVNDDGLEVRFGSEQGAVARGGEIAAYGEEKQLTLDVVGTEVPATASQVPIDKNVTLPPGSYITSATFYVDTAFVGATATLDLGVMNDDGDGTFSVLDADGIDVDIAITAIDAADDEIACNGALVGTSPVNATDATLPLVFSYGFATAALTAGRGRLVVKYRPTVV